MIYISICVKPFLLLSQFYLDVLRRIFKVEKEELAHKLGIMRS